VEMSQVIGILGLIGFTGEYFIACITFVWKCFLLQYLPRGLQFLQQLWKQMPHASRCYTWQSHWVAWSANRKCRNIEITREINRYIVCQNVSLINCLSVCLSTTRYYISLIDSESRACQVLSHFHFVRSLRHVSLHDAKLGNYFQHSHCFLMP
jgi:hypothetical protein